MVEPLTVTCSLKPAVLLVTVSAPKVTVVLAVLAGLDIIQRLRFTAGEKARLFLFPHIFHLLHLARSVLFPVHIY